MKLKPNFDGVTISQLITHDFPPVHPLRLVYVSYKAVIVDLPFNLGKDNC